MRKRAPVIFGRAAAEIESPGPTLTPQAQGAFARQARKRMRDPKGGDRGDHLWALAQRVEVDRETHIIGDKSALLRTLVAASGAKRRELAFPVLFRSGAPRSMKMGNIPTLWRYEALSGPLPQLQLSPFAGATA